MTTILPEVVATIAGAGGATLIAAARARGQRRRSPLPHQTSAMAPDAILAWVGTGTAEAWKGDTWVRQPAQDYEFAVVQRRFTGHWESVKMMNRRHPDYDGSAGPRDQVHFFRLGLQHDEGRCFDLSLESSMGRGSGRADEALRAFEFALDIDAPALARRMMPFDRLGFVQSYAYESARLTETITLTKADAMAFRMQETADMLSRTPLSEAPGRIHS